MTKRHETHLLVSRLTFRRATTELYMYMSRILHDMSHVVVEVGWDWTGAECVGVGFLFGSGLNVLLATANEQPTKPFVLLQLCWLRVD